jgi:hypothetical protein
MKRGVAVPAVVAVSALLVVAASGAKAAEAWQRFVHPSLGFSLSYPAGWDVLPIREGTIGVAILGPQIAGTGGLRLNVNVASELLPREGTVEMIEALAERQVSLILNNYQRLRSDRTTVGGRPAILRYFTWNRNDGLMIYQMELFTYAGRRAYVVTGTALASSPAIAQEAGTLQRIVASFRVKK